MNNMAWTSNISKIRPRGKLLLVEDDPVVMDTLKGRYTALGYEVHLVQPIAEHEQGEQHIPHVCTIHELDEVIASVKPDHVLTGKHLGDAAFDGENVVALVRSKSRLVGIPVVMHTDSVQHPMTRRKRGEKDYWVLPKNDQFTDQVDALLQGQPRGLRLV